MNQGARDANSESARAGADNSLKEINQRLDTIATLLFRVLEKIENPPQHLWPRQ
jgi:hypothetical protein